jgi:hypothetical protein
MMNRILLEDRLDGTTNFSSWKSRLLITLEESDLMKYVEEVVRESTNDAEKSQWRKKDHHILCERPFNPSCLQLEDN